MTTAPVVFVGDADLSVRSSPNQPAIKICWMLFASYCRKIGRDARASKGRYPCVSPGRRRISPRFKSCWGCPQAVAQGAHKEASNAET